ncbi:inositol monophosphatase family protein [Gluconacetobacter entanii]|uniref:inositol monophosphatase family protein n=1 Tax=Gluconacetobacter entanii TaxID=108528 RepID=UPI001C935E86|nr:inositol monophosphatase family protein [Gluconacetobacter entanii]MBY4639880.1 inositol monophosphatase family protein [Gluconacetobacter entanii]MCW4581097.1 inositol monophosphatase family protein [Gluconacetobacter entanii]MCW4584357.1 inositol monophosphatase family protein [Gluconacetobacter entanii]MCW4587771.1 inositol monophosphatase family protein [Gluconacetobacter entanii]
MTDPLAHMAQFIAAAQAAADVAACIVRPFFRAGVSADDKADQSPVTIADRTAERAIRAVIGERLPHHGIMGEEFGTERPDAAYRWVIDPVDGTRAFLTGRPTFGTLIALLHEGVPVLGIIDQPITGERWIGMRGEPTRYLSHFAGQAGTRLCPALDRAELSCTSPEILEGAYRARWDVLSRAVKRVSWGGDCYAYGLLALGQVDVIAECTMKPWDWAALVPVVEGAGGSMTDWAGQPLRLDGDGTVLALGNPALLPQACRLLAK